MIDLHSHILPGIDDGAADLAVSLTMARAFVADGVTTVACTPHILPGLYHNSGPQIRQAVAELQAAMDQDGIPLKLIAGADNHITANFVGGLQSGQLLTLNDTRYVLVEPPHHTIPARLEDMFFSLLVAGYVPILTHPERLTWITAHYGTVERLAHAGVWMQITAGSLTGGFGRQPRYWAERMLDEGLVHILATDAHDAVRRPPMLGKGRDAAAKRVGAAEAGHLVLTRPAGIVANALPNSLPQPSRDNAGTASALDSADPESANGNAGRSRSFSERLRRLFVQ
jgi:protein-tyrosine phosphatase